MRVVWQLVVVVVIAVAGTGIVGAVQGISWLSLTLGLLIAALAVLAYRWVVRRTERRDPVELGGAGAGAALGGGVLAGVGLVLTGLLFGLLHLLNPNASLWGALAIAVEAGGLLTAAYVATRRLWLPIGLHFGWNIAVGGIFSTEVSGSGTAQGLLDATTSGPAFLTGGAGAPRGRRPAGPGRERRADRLAGSSRSP